MTLLTRSWLPQVRQLERTVGLKDLTVAEMEGRLREMSATTFDGVFVWRISDFAKKRQDAIAGRAPAMFSPGRVADLGIGRFNPG